MTSKIDSQRNSDWVAHRYSNTFRREAVGPAQRLVIAPSDRPSAIALLLVQQLTSPVLLLWILHTPRGGSKAARYQSPPLELETAIALLKKFTPFFEEDARSDIWVHARNPDATVVLDRHNLLYAYGDLARFTTVLVRHGLTEGAVDVPSPHAHNYHPEYDGAEREFAASIDWRVSDLRPGDEQ